MKFTTLIFAALSVAGIYAGDCGPGIGKCGDGKCCSKYGWCGTSDKYCGTGCQEGYGICNSTRDSQTPSSTFHPVSEDGSCGPKNGNTSCPPGECCSKYGWCGTSISYCGSGCQSEFGQCGTTTTNTTTKKTTVTKTTTTKKSSATSTNGKCGTKDGKCPSGECCSKYGYCGRSDKHCSSGCQSEFGQCH